METRTAVTHAWGPDYWLDQADKAAAAGYAVAAQVYRDAAWNAERNVDRLSEDECPMDDVQEGEEREVDERTAALIHVSYTCPHPEVGMHSPEDCPAGGV